MNVGLKFESVVRREANAFNIVFDFILLLSLLAPYLRRPFLAREQLLGQPLDQQQERVPRELRGRPCGLHRPAIWQWEDTKEPWYAVSLRGTA